MKNNGAEGDLELHYPNKLGIWSTLCDRTYDATWIFTAWEGIEAGNHGIDLTTFRLGDFNIPYGCSPVLCASEAMINDGSETLTKFLSATQRGFEFAISNPQEAANILKLELTDHDRKHIDLLKSQRMLNNYYIKNGTWGVMDSKVFNTFVNWLKEHELVPNTLDANHLYTIMSY